MLGFFALAVVGAFLDKLYFLVDLAGGAVSGSAEGLDLAIVGITNGIDADSVIGSLDGTSRGGKDVVVVVAMNMFCANTSETPLKKGNEYDSAFQAR